MPQLLEIREIAEIALVGHTFPDYVGAGGLGEGCTINAEEDVAGVGEVFHEGDTQFVGEQEAQGE